jgi:outer membrane protein TolC
MNMKKEGYHSLAARVAVVAALLFSAFALAAEPAALTVDEATRLALAGNPDLARARLAARADIARGDSRWNAFLPDLSLSASAQTAHPFLSIPESAGEWSGSVGGAMSLTLNAGVASTMRQADLASRDAALSLEALEADVVARVRKSFYSLLTARESLRISRLNRDLAARQAAEVRRHYENGLASELELLQAQYSEAALGPVVMKEESAYRDAVRAFNALLGLSPEEDRPLDGALVYRPVREIGDEERDASIERRWDVRRASLAVENARSKSVGGKLRTLGPSVTFSERLSVSGTTAGGGVSDGATFGASVALPLNGYVPGSAERIDLGELADAVKSAEIAAAQARVSAALEIESLREAIARVDATIGTVRLNARLAARAYELSEQGYSAGLASQRDLEEARQRKLEAEQAVLSALNDHRAATIDLAMALAMDEANLYADPAPGAAAGSGAQQ